MTDNPEQVLDQQQASGQQTAGAAGTAPAGYIEIARYNGLVRKVEELTLTNRSLNEQLVAKSSEIEQLKGELSIKDAEKSTAVGERDTRLNQLLTDNSALQTELKELRGLKLKVEVANELKRPELLKLAERIPALEDKEALTAIMSDFAKFADEAVSAREAQLLSGVTPSMGPGSVTPAEPATPQAWLEKINGMPLGSPERAKALDQYGDWLEKQNAK
jgi:predicted RNase H-like nuclease (RuvC/YqgF family)